MPDPRLLSRDEFRESVFQRDNHQCVLCGAPAQDAHHIMERRLFPDGGYFLDNGASVCGPCHILCEQTIVSVEEVREKIGSTRPVLPPHLYWDVVYDKWGNVILSNGTRLAGDLFHDESVQKILGEGGRLIDFRPWVKYPRTYHLPFSPGTTDDDRVMPDSRMRAFDQKRIIVTEKMDGENTTMYQDHIHARSVDSSGHPSRNWVKNLWSTIAHDIPPGWRICGENMYAKHSIGYDRLPSFFLAFSIWNERNVCLSWDESVEWFRLLGLHHVPVLYDGMFDSHVIKGLVQGLDSETSEGFVLRDAGPIHYSDFRNAVGKYVRANHVRTVKHWMHGQRIEPNALFLNHDGE